MKTQTRRSTSSTNDSPFQGSLSVEESVVELEISGLCFHWPPDTRTQVRSSMPRLVELIDVYFLSTLSA